MSSSSNPCYAQPNTEHHWQGDVYLSSDFHRGVIPVGSDRVSHWMLMNRTCHLVSGNGRDVKIPYLVFCACIPLAQFIKDGASAKKASLKNQISNIVNAKDENIILLPKEASHGLSEDFVVDFNMVWSVNIDKCPASDKKCVQLSSPFCEHLVQRFSRWFFSIGFDDAAIKSQASKDQLQKSVEDKNT